MSKATFSIRGEHFEIDARRDADQLRLAGDDATYEWEIQRVGRGQFVAREVGASRGHSIHAVRDGTARWVHLDGRTYRFEAVVERGGAATAPGSLQAPIPATVLEVLVAEGDSVAADQVLVVLSAMKMQLEIRAPHAGTVSALHHEAGDSVDSGEQLVAIEATDGEKE